MARKSTVVDAIVKEIEKGQNRSAILATIGNNWQISQRTFDRYWKTANEQHAIKQDAIKTELAVLDIQNAIDARKKAIMSVDDRKEWLTGLILKPLKIVYEDEDGNTITETVNYDNKLKAMAELNKMDGAYAPNKTEHSGNLTITEITGMKII